MTVKTLFKGDFMETIKRRWRAWKHYTDTWEKTQHGFLVAVSLWHILISITQTSGSGWIAWTSTLIFVWLTYEVIKGDVWENAYKETNGLRRMGAQLAEALTTHTFVKASKAEDKTYYIEPDIPAEDPDSLEDGIFTDEIVIRSGMNTEGSTIVAYRIPHGMAVSEVVSALETTKLLYAKDRLEHD